jgi:serine/threonine-protein kinase
MSSADEAAELSIGQVVGKYRVESLIGTGGMAAVYRGVHEELDHRVAIKILLPRCLNDKRLVTRFVREAKTIAKLKSRHVARVFDIGRIETTRAPYIVMELLEGEDLGKKLDTQAPFGIQRAVDYVIQASEGLAHAHAAGIVHRDVKPGNLFLARDTDGREVVKVIDFGIAKQIAAGDVKLTSTNDVFGSPQYMAPEQIRGAGRADARTDVWALGVVLYELLTGASAFSGESVLELAGSILHNAPTPIGTYRRDIPPSLERVILRCLDKTPTKRFRNACDYALALAPFASPAGKSIALEMKRTFALPTLSGADDPAFDPTVVAKPPGEPSDDTTVSEAVDEESEETTTAVSQPAISLRPLPFITMPDAGPPSFVRRSRTLHWIRVTSIPVAIVVGTVIGGGAKLSAKRAAVAKTAAVEATSSPPPAIDPPLPVEVPADTRTEPRVPPAASAATTAAASVVPPRNRAEAFPSSSRVRPRVTTEPGRAFVSTPIVPRKGGD